MKSLLWSEPERVMPGTDLYNKHRDWLIAPPSGVADPSHLLDFGNPSAWNWVLDRFDSIISNQGARGRGTPTSSDRTSTWTPFPIGTRLDVPGRSGMTQVKHVTGHLAFWDSAP